MIKKLASSSMSAASLPSAAIANAGAGRTSEKAATEQKFNEVLGEVMFGTMLKTVRQAKHKPAYFHGGRGEEVFGQQLDQILSEKMGKEMAGRMGNSLGSLSQLPRP